MIEEDFKGKELISIKLSRNEYQTLKSIIEEREAYSLIVAKIKGFWLWTVVTIALSVFAMWEYLKPLFIKSGVT